jgi:DNA-binding transcriptional MerR regulator
MRDRILAKPKGDWLTTARVARMLRVTPQAVRWFARTGQLTSNGTCDGQWLFREEDVLRLAAQRAKRQGRSRYELLVAVRPQMLRASLAPKQARLRLMKVGA